MDKEADPFTELTENFSSIPFIAPPPFGSVIEGTSMAFDFVFPLSVLRKDSVLFFGVVFI